MDTFLHPDTRELTTEAMMRGNSQKFARLTESLGKVLDDYSLVKFHPLDIGDEENLCDLLMIIDNTIQYGEDLEVRTESLENLAQDDDDENEWMYFS